MEENDIREKIYESITAKDPAALNNLFENMEAIDFAQAAEDLEDEDLRQVFEMLSKDNQTALMEEADDELRLRLAKTIDNDSLLTLFSHMQKDDIVDILGDFPTGRRIKPDEIRRQENNYRSPSVSGGICRRSDEYCLSGTKRRPDGHRGNSENT